MLLPILLSIYLLFHLFLSVVLVRVSKIKLLDEIVPKIDNYPSVSVILTWCNEEEIIGRTIHKLLETEYPSLEIIAINDRSTDSTGNIIEGIAEEYEKLNPVTIKNLPDGRLWKLHALHKWVQQAQWEWIIFTDADVSFEKHTIKKIITYAIENDFDHIAVLPEIITSSLALKIMVQWFWSLFLQWTALFKEEKSNESVIWIWWCNVVRRSTFDKTPWFEWLKMEVADDVWLAYMLKKVWAKSTLLFSKIDISLSRYSSIKEMIHWLEKNLFGTMTQYSYSKLIWISLMFLWYVLIPWITLLYSWSSLFFIFRLLIHVGTTYLASNNLDQSFSVLFFTPIGLLMICYALLNSAYKTRKNNWIIWRGTLYSINELRLWQRVKLSWISNKKRSSFYKYK